MENQTGIISFRLPAHIQIANSAPNFWDLIHEHGAEVDRLSGYDHEMVTALTDWLATESRVSGLQSSSVAYSANTLLLGLFDFHALNVLRVRLGKRKNTDARTVFDAYGLSSSNTPPDGDWMGFLSRQSDHLQSHDHQLLLLCVQTDHYLR